MTVVIAFTVFLIGTMSGVALTCCSRASSISDEEEGVKTI